MALGVRGGGGEGIISVVRKKKMFRVGVLALSAVEFRGECKVVFVDSGHSHGVAEVSHALRAAG